MSRGISLYIAILIMAILLAIVLGVSTILVTQIRIIRGMENSVVAFYAAESGIEKVLKDRTDPSGWDGDTETLSNSADYEITVISGGVGDCPVSKLYCIKSVGNYEKTNRAIQVSY